MDLEIASKENPNYKELKRISRENGNYIFIEGKKLFCEAVNNSIKIKRIFTDKKNKSYILSLLPEGGTPEIVFVKNHLLSTLFTTESKPSDEDLIIALAKKPVWGINDLFKTKKNLIFLEEIQDPGNLGTILRSVLALDAGGVILSESSVNPFNTKVVRASAGAIFSCPIITIDDIERLIDLARKEKYKIVATSLKASKKLTELDFDFPYIFLFGNEGKGLSKKLLDIADDKVVISHSKKVESLNLAVAVSLTLWEMYRNKATPPLLNNEKRL